MNARANTFETIDRELKEWRETLVVATTNLLSLTETPIYKRLAGRDGRAAADLSGSTQTRVDAALVSVRELFEGFARLKSTIERAEELRRAPSWPWMEEARVNEIAQLLRKDSIELTSTETPFEQRGLLSSSRQLRRITPQELLSAMTRTYEEARDAILGVEEAWESLDGRLTTSEREADSLKASLNPDDTIAQGELRAVQKHLKSLREMLHKDPLGVQSALQGSVVPQLARLRERNTLAARETVELANLINNARDLLWQIERERAKCEQLRDECRRLLNAPTREPSPVAVSDDLARWFATLEETARVGRTRPARIGLERWRDAAQGTLAQERTASEFNRAALDRLAELRGRLDACEARARSLEARGTRLTLAIWDTAREAQSLLQRKPVPLDYLARLVASVEGGLRLR